MPISLVSASRVMWCPGLAQISGHPKTGLHYWLSNGTYAPSVVGNTLVLTGVSKQHFLSSLAADVNRLSSAASETLRNIAEVQDIPKSLAWPHVKLYYASLFYAHAVLRLWGRSPSYFRTEELMHLRRTLAAYGITAPFKVTTGQFVVLGNLATGDVEILPESGGDGTHEAVWKLLVKALDEWEASVPNSPYIESDRLETIKGIRALKALLTKGGAHNSWLSQMRNSIQYRQAEGVWYPYATKARTSTLQQNVKDILEGKAELDKLIQIQEPDLLLFRSACSYLIHFSRGVIDDMCAIGGPKSFLNFGQRKFEDSSRVV